MIIGIDFDGTIVTHEFPRIGRPVPGALETMRELNKHGHRIILWTMRSGVHLEAAVEYLQRNEITLYGVNQNPDQDWSDSPKAFCHLYIDDAALGCPLELSPLSQRPYVYWPRIKSLLVEKNIIK